MTDMMVIRRLTKRGIETMENFLDSFTDGEGFPLSEIEPILTGADTSVPVPNRVPIDRNLVFPRRFDLAQYLDGIIPKLGLRDPMQDWKLWSWLALAWFDQLAPMKKGVRQTYAHERWIPRGKWKTYRHLVLGPCMLHASNRDHPERAMALLLAPPHTPGDVVGQLAATYRVVQSQSMISAATTLYYDPNAQQFKPGARGSGPGSPRRLRDVLNQFDRTYDLQSLREDQLLELLPGEFNRFLPAEYRRR